MLTHALCRVCVFRAHANIPSVQYELPDGKVLDVGAERFAIPEVLFDANRPLAWAPTVGLLPPPPPTRLPHARAQMVSPWLRTDTPRIGVHQMIFDAISASDADIRKDLYSNIILTGGNSLLPGTHDTRHTRHDTTQHNTRNDTRH